MSETSSDIMDRREAVKTEPFVLPQWAFDAIRPAGIALCRALWQIGYTGIQNVPRSGGLIIAANHQTYIDPFWVGFPIKRPLRFLAWDESFDWPVVGRMMHLFGAWPLQLEKSDPRAIRRALQWLRQGGAIVIFPEGGRGNPDGSMVNFKNGAVRMAIEANVPILPVTIRGAHRVWPKTRRFPRIGRVEVFYHQPHELVMLPGEDARTCARRENNRIAEIIKSGL